MGGNYTAIGMTTSTADTRKLYQQVAGAIAGAIEQGRYHAGGRLPSERDLAEEFGVSRPTVREAMIALEIRGLVETRQGSGVYVTDARPDTPAPELDIGAFELTESRRLFEGEVCALAATTITDAELAEMDAILLQMIDENAFSGFTGEAADRRFHVAIAQSTRNAAMVMVVENLWDLRYRSPLCAAMLERGRAVGVRPLIEDHRAILDALKARDATRAREAMRAHLGHVIEDLLTATEVDAMERARNDVAARRQELARRTAI